MINNKLPNPNYKERIRRIAGANVKTSENMDKWPDDVVYTIYSNEVLETLPVIILEQMRNHIQSVIDKAIIMKVEDTNIEKKDRLK